MTSQKDQIQTLIAEIDKVLQKPSTRLPWVMSGETAQQRRVLERVRSYLVSLQQRMAADDPFSQARTKSNLSTYDIQYQPSQSTQTTDYARVPIAPIGNSQDAAARQILQAVVQEMDHLRTSLTQPLQADLEALRQQRESLVQEIRQLEAQRQHYSLAQQQANQQKIISEFLQVLMGRLQDSLAQQVAQTLSTLQSQTPYDLNSAEPIALSVYGTGSQPLLNPGQRLEQLQMLQARSDQLLMNLDSTLGVVFEALQRNVQSYQESLSTGLERMHDLGQQGEVMFTALASHLAQQLGREASSFLHSSLPTSELEAGATANAEAMPQQTSISPAEVSVAPPAPLSASQPPGSRNPSYDAAALDLPYAGAELRQDSDRSPLSELRSELDDADDLGDLADLNLEGLDLADVVLEDVELNSDNLDALLDVDLSSTGTESSSSSQSELLDTLPQSDWLDSPATTSADLATSASELEFLEQLDIALQHPDPEPELAADLGTGAELPELGWVGETSSQEIASSGVSAESRLETDELYASLFGSDDFSVELEEQPEAEAFAASSSAAPPAIVDLPVVPEIPELPDAWVGSGATTDAQLTPSSDLASMQAGDLFAELPEAAPVANREPLIAMPEVIASDSPPTTDELDETVTTLEEFLFADAPDLPSDENFGLPNFNLPSPSAAAQSVEALTPAIEPAEANLDAFRSSYVDETDELGDPDLLAELAELLGDAEVIPAQPSFGTTRTAPSGLPSQPSPVQSNQEELEDESELLLSELSLQDVPVLNVNDTTQGLEDSYVPAAPEEYLIAIDDGPGDETEGSLWLEENIVQQLDEDLSSLEGLDGLFFESTNAENNVAERGPESKETAASNPENAELESADLLGLDENQPPAWLDAVESPDPQAWDNLTLENFAETLPETLPSLDPVVEAKKPEALSDELAAFWEEADLASTPTAPPSVPLSDLTLDAFDLLADLPAIAPPSSVEKQSIPAGSKPQPSENQPTELDTQSLTIDDAFMDFSAAMNQLSENSDRNIAPPDSSKLQADEKKKIE